MTYYVYEKNNLVFKDFDKIKLNHFIRDNRYEIIEMKEKYYDNLIIKVVK